METDTRKNRTQYEDEESTIDFGTVLGDVVRFLNRFGLQILLTFAIIVVAMIGYQNSRYSPSYVAKITYAVNKTGVPAIDIEVAQRVRGNAQLFFGEGEFYQDVMGQIKEETVNGNYSFSCILTSQTNLITVKVNANNYLNANILLDSLKEVFPVWVSKATGTVDLQIVNESPAKNEPENPYSFLGILATSLLAGAFVCIGLFVLYNMSVHTVRKESDMKKITEKSCIISIPEVETKKRSNNNKKELLLNKKRIDWGFRQAVLAAHSRIEKLMSKDGHQALLVSSTLPQEGKSLLVVNLAIAFAQHNKKVLLIDGDMRNPSVGKILNLSLGKRNLTNYFKGQARLSDIIIEGPGFSIIHSGSQKGAVSQYATDAKMNALMKQLKQEYDYILIDTPAAYLFTDAALWAKYVDDIVYVIKYDDAHQREIQSGMEALDQEDKVLGYIVNRTPGGFTSYGYGKYGYGKYGYGKYRYGKYGYYGGYSKYIEIDEEAMNTEDTL